MKDHDIDEARYLCPHAARRTRTFAKRAANTQRRAGDRQAVLESLDEIASEATSGPDCSQSCPCGQVYVEPIERPWLTIQLHPDPMQVGLAA